MSVELLQTLSLIAYILAGLCFLLAVALFFYLKVPTLWGEVSGRTARKAIQTMKWKGEDASAKPLSEAAPAPTLTNEAPHLIAAEQNPPLKAAPTINAALGQTDVLPTAEAGQTDLLPQPSVVTTPSDMGETAVLSTAAYSEFVIRSTGELPQSGETTLLGQEQREPQSTAPSIFFVMEKELAFTDSTEIIE